MVKSCCVWGCTALYRSGVNLGFYKFPKDVDRRRDWVRKISRAKVVSSTVSPSGVCASNVVPLWEPGKWDLVCGRHFVTGKPSSDPDHPDYKPSLNLKSFESSSRGKISRYNRTLKRRRLFDTDENPDLQKGISDGTATNCVEVKVKTDIELLEEKYNALQLQFDKFKEQKKIELDMLNVEINSLRIERDNLGEKLSNRKVDVDYLTDQKCRFYTGINTVSAFLWIVSLCEMYVSQRRCISVGNQILLSLMKLRLDLQNNDLAYRFGLSSTTISEILNECLPVLSERLKCLIKWPSKVIIRKNLPHSFRKRFSNCRVIIDCTEFFIDRPYNLKARGQTWSNYKHHHTLKALIGITPYGAISFVSKMWGGRISDKEITAKSGFYDMIEPGDQVMADRGFTISHELAIRGAHLVMPPFVAGRKQFPGVVVFRARQISALRIHVERAIERIKNFKILKNTLPLSLVPLASSILNVCCALTNLKPNLIK